MKGILRIGLTQGCDGTGELFISFEAHGFSGHGSAWFNLATLAMDIEKFADFPLVVDALPVIRGGYWNKNGTGLDQGHVYLSAEPRGTTGDVFFLVRLSIPADNPSVSEPSFSISGELKTSYEQLAQMVRDMNLLLKGEKDEIVLFEQT
jgi:hypothetical protein